MKSILIVDDHGIVRQGLSKIVTEVLGYSDLDQAENCHSLMAALHKKTYTHLLADIVLPDGQILEVLPTIRKLYPDTGVAILSQQPANIFVPVLADHGIKKYILKSAPDEELVSDLRDFIEDVPGPLYRGLFRKTPFDDLSHRELEVLHYILCGEKPGGIANKLGISYSTVGTHTQRIYEKTATRSIKQLTKLSAQFGLTEGRE
ncbi:hypothetical protein DCC81_03860 [Chitinophaga parva]|uniref:DNA-binding response regulator n=1 Tax=Chitinophaga parva TaxID=2169414 RepID=A0A2T7BLV3_9BACT|nr:response regulator transcription factor [Chitinophaga parva]PUZ28629.1 hypothetical protein DCC81_03860 [Chitinophaga parva]